MAKTGLRGAETIGTGDWSLQVRAARMIEQLNESKALYHRLVLMVAPPRAGKTALLLEISRVTEWPRINLNLRLSEKLLDLTTKQRAIHVPALVEEVVAASGSDIVLLDNIELLFAENLAQDPLRLLQRLARNRTIGAAWPGSANSGVLTYAEPGHVEFRKYAKPEAVVVTISSSASQELG